jgi:hypothetical protein
MGMLAAGEWLERRTLAAEEVVPRRLRRMASKPPEAVEAMVLEETAHVVAQYWSATGRPVSEAPAASNRDLPAGAAGPAAPAASRNGNGGRHARRATPGRGGRHARRR